MAKSKSVKKRRVLLEGSKLSIVNIKDLRNIAQRAVILSKTVGSVKVTYPFEHGMQIDIEYTDQKNLFNYAMAYGVLLNQVSPNALSDNKKFAECSFFCCANCNKVGKQHQDKLITNFCKKCSSTYQKKNEEEIKIRNDILRAKEKPDKLEEPIFSPHLKEVQVKEKIKKVSPVKLKFKK